MKLSDKAYDILKWLAMYFIPALGTLYFALAQIWGLPYGQEIVGTLSAVDTFLAVLLGISKSNYPGDGQIMMDSSSPETNSYRIVLNDETLDAIKDKKFVSLKVNPDADLSEV